MDLREIRREAWRRLCKLTTFGPSGPHMTRYAMYKRLGEIGKTLPSGGRALCISDSANVPDLMGVKPAEIIEVRYPAVSMTKLPFEDGQFDWVFSDQVLEHVEGDPCVAVEESRRVLKPGGIAVHTTVFSYPVHGSPNDYWRYTPDALRFLCRSFSQIIECAGWGNLDAHVWARNGLQFVSVPHATWHPLHKLATRNDPEWPMVVWVLARK